METSASNVELQLNWLFIVFATSLMLEFLLLNYTNNNDNNFSIVFKQANLWFFFFYET